jgi:hypothetical protein
MGLISSTETRLEVDENKKYIFSSLSVTSNYFHLISVASRRASLTRWTPVTAFDDSKGGS